MCFKYQDNINSYINKYLTPITVFTLQPLIPSRYPFLLVSCLFFSISLEKFKEIWIRIFPHSVLFHNCIIFHCVDVTYFSITLLLLNKWVVPNLLLPIILTGHNAICVSFLTYVGRSVYLLNSFQKLLGQMVLSAAILVDINWFLT